MNSRSKAHLPSFLSTEILGRSDDFSWHAGRLWILVFTAVGFSLVFSIFSKRSGGIPVVNRKFALEPRWFSRIRWAFWAEEILDDAYAKYDGQPYRVARGDCDYTVLPSQYVSELNRLPQTVLNSRMCHSYSMTGHITGMDVVLQTALHVKTLLQRIGPALPELLPPCAARIEESLAQQLPQDTQTWTITEPLDKVVYCVSRAAALISIGEPVCDDPILVRLLFTYTKQVMFTMRFVPAFLQPILVWLHPHKWQMLWSLRELEAFCVPELIKRRNQEKPNPDLLSWMMADAKTERESDPKMLTQLLGALAAGGTYSSANFICSVILDLVNHPHDLEEIRQEITQKHREINGKWDFAAFESLYKLDSAMKETARLSPGSLTTYSRVMVADYMVSNGHQLRKGDFICINSHAQTKDPRLTEDPLAYDALRAYKALSEHQSQPFKNTYNGEYRWGAGRWACAGRFFATMVSKIILVKMLDEYDFRFDGATRPPNSVIHEFIFMHPNVKLLIRRREQNSGISFS